LIQPSEIASGVWLFHNAEANTNCALVHTGSRALLIDPDALAGLNWAKPKNLAPVERHALAHGLQIEMVILTHAGRAEEMPDLWPDVLHISPATPGLSIPWLLPLSGWELLPLSANMLGVHSPAQRILFCGDMLSSTLIPYLRGGSRAYLDNLARVQELDLKLVVPLLGSPAQGKRAIRERIDSDRDYIHALQRHITTSLAAGAALDRVIEVARQIYQDFPFLEEHIDNLGYVWHELAEA
jgi:glyoxylase-like metal-dependent hydrolase (beta-lactamase superfamily II)